MDTPMSIEFDCGTLAQGVGNIQMALRHHLTVCESPDCIADVNRALRN